MNLLAGSSGEGHADDVGDLLSGSEEDLTQNKPEQNETNERRGKEDNKARVGSKRKR